jgi:hypothetical protein
VWGGSRRRHGPHTRLVPQPPNPDLRRVSLSHDAHTTTWKVIASNSKPEENRNKRRTTPAKGKNACSQS